jgi:hypothetical protein
MCPVQAYDSVSIWRIREPVSARSSSTVSGFPPVTATRGGYFATTFDRVEEYERRVVGLFQRALV